ncbi:MAG: ABC transporter ATP-binding protein [Pseudomonadota bacterium]
MSEPTAAMLSIEDVRKEYGSKVVLEDVDLQVSEGEICTLVGPSGCGKSTLLRLILGQEFPTRGTLRIDGSTAGFPDPSRGIVFQRYGLYPHLSVIDNVTLGRTLTQGVLERRRRRAENREAGMAMLERVRLGAHADKYPHELSGGMQQRVAIAQSLMMKPRILLMDEPFGALDPDTREEMQLFLLELWEEEQMTIFFVTHDLEEALFVGTRILVLSQYYSDDRGDGVQRGSRIVADHHLAPIASATHVKNDPEFRRLIDSLREDGFDPAYQQHVREFNLKHSDSFQTLDGDVASGAPD